MSESKPRIRTPVTVHLRRIRHQLIPVLVFFAALWGAFFLWRHPSVMTHTIGEVETVEYEMAAPADGVLTSLGAGGGQGVPGGDGARGDAEADQEVHLHEAVARNAVLARLDDRPAGAALRAVRAEADRLRAEVVAERLRASADLADARMDRANHRRRLIAEARALALDVERVRLDVLDRKALIETDRIELARQSEQYAALKKLFDQGVATEFTLADRQLRRDVVDQRVQSGGKALAEAEAQLAAVRARFDQAVERLKEEDLGPLPDVEALTAPYRAAVAAQEARVEEIAALVANLTIRSPIDGVISQVYLRPGQAVAKGQPIVAVAAEKSHHVISYIREHQLIRPKPGDEVRIVIRGVPRRIIAGTIASVGPQVRAVPGHHLADPKGREWGLPVRIEISPDERIRPGELVDVSFVRPN